MVNVAVLGFGTVGSGVVEVITGNHDKIAQNAGQEINIKYILDLKDFKESPFADKIIKDFAVIEQDPDVQIVVETMGGKTFAYDFTKRSLLAGKSVVTSNKELVAAHGYELLKIAKEKNVNYLFEASVGGGIPILRPLTQCLAGNEIEEIYGILNGTTNYILTQMIKNGLSFDTALRQAQEKGYAELNPEADVGGHDTCRKICILSALAFGRHIYPEQVPTEGITNITLDDVENADKRGYRIKLLGRTKLVDGKAAAYVAPHLIREDALLASVEDVFNGIVVKGNAIGEVLFYGAGAGKLPTASAVVGDVIDEAQHLTIHKDIGWEEGGEDTVSDPSLLKSKWYVRAAMPAEAAGRLFSDVKEIDVIYKKNGEMAFITSEFSRYELDRELLGCVVKAAFRVL